MTTPKRLACAIVIAGAASSPRSADAQPTDTTRTAAGQVLYDEAMKSYDAGRYAEACPKFEEASRIVPEGIGVKLMLASCWEHAGRLASAWTMYRAAESEAGRANQADRQKKAADAMAALEPKLAKVTVDVAPALRGATDLAVTKDGVPVGSALYGVAIPVDSGTVTIDAHASTGVFHRVLEVRDGDAKTVVVDALVPAEEGPTAPVTSTPETAPVAPDEHTPSRRIAPLPTTPTPSAEDGALETRTVAGIVIGSVGVAAAAVGAGLGAHALSLASDANDVCPNDACTSQDAIDLDGDANTMSVVSWVMLGTGVAAITVGVVLIALPSGDTESTVSLRVSPSGFSVGGVF